MALKLTNNATSRLAVSLSNSDTTVVLAAGDGDKFPTLSPGDWFPITIVRADAQREIMYATARASDVLTVSRGQEGTAALSFAPNDRIELRATAGVFATFFPTTGGSVSGNLSVGGTLSAAAFSGGLDVPGALKQGGQQVWHSGNFNPGTKADLYRPAFTGPVTLNYGSDFTTATWHVCAKIRQIGAIQWPSEGGAYAYGYGVSSGTFYWFKSAADDGSAPATYLLTLDSSGNLIATGNVAAYSDRKHKTNIRTISGGLAMVERMRGVRYVRKDDGSECIGVIAQEVADVFPEVVGDGVDGLHVSYGNLVAPLIEAVKELSARVRTLEAK